MSRIDSWIAKEIEWLSQMRKYQIFSLFSQNILGWQRPAFLLVNRVQPFQSQLKRFRSESSHLVHFWTLPKSFEVWYHYVSDYEGPTSQDFSWFSGKSLRQRSSDTHNLWVIDHDSWTSWAETPSLPVRKQDLYWIWLSFIPWKPFLMKHWWIIFPMISSVNAPKCCSCNSYKLQS